MKIKGKKILIIAVIAIVSIFVLPVLVFLCFDLYRGIEKQREEQIAEQIYRSEHKALNNLTGDSLYQKCNEIIEHHQIPKCWDEERDESNLRSVNYHAWEKIEELAYDGNANAQYMLAKMYDGYSYWYQSWESEKIDYHKIGESYTNLGPDYDKAAYWYLKAAEQNHAAAQHAMAYMYANGSGVHQNLDKAFHWLRKSAYNGNPVAQLNLGDYFRDGISIEQNIDSAKYYWRKAAAQGYNKVANDRLQKIYE